MIGSESEGFYSDVQFGWLPYLASNEKQKLQQPERRERRGTPDYAHTGSDPRSLRTRQRIRDIPSNIILI